MMPFHRQGAFMAQNPTTQANDFLRATALEIMDQPEFSSRSGAALLDPVENAKMASEVAARALSAARSKLEHSNATIAFEALCISDRDALADSTLSAFGPQAAQALRSDTAAYAMIPQRSSSMLSAWRFADGSFLLCSRSADDSLAAFGKALLACPSFLALLAPKKEESISRALRLAASPNGAFPLSRPALASLLESMRDGAGWKTGTRVLDRDGKRVLPPDELLASLDASAPHMSLDQIIAEVLARKPHTPT
jgi:hypothetical protein